MSIDPDLKWHLAYISKTIANLEELAASIRDDMATAKAARLEAAERKAAEHLRIVENSLNDARAEHKRLMSFL